MSVGEVVLKLHNLWVLEVFLTEQEVANIKQCRANLLERSTAKHTLNDVASKRLENTRSPRPYGTWRRNMTPSFRTGLVAASEKVSEHSSGLNNLTSPTWVLKRKNLEAVPSPVEGYHIEPDSQKEASIEALPEENMDDAFQDDKVDATAPIEIVKQTSKTSVDSYHTPPMVTSPKPPLAAPDLEDIEDVTPEEQTSDASSSVDAPSSGDAPLGNHISSTSTLVKSAEMVAHSTSDHPDIHPPTFYSTSSNGSSNDDNNLSQSQLPEDSISLKTAEDSQQSHYGSVDEDKAINFASLAEEISKLKVEDKVTLVEENVVHENGWVSMDNESDELNNRMDLNTPQTDKKHESPIKGTNKKISPELHSNCDVNHDTSNVLLPDGDSPNDITLSNVVTSSKPPTELLDHETPVVVLHSDDKVRQEANILVDSGNGEDAGVSPTLSSVSCSDGRSSCRSSNLYTPQTASSEVQDNEVNT